VQRPRIVSTVQHVRHSADRFFLLDPLDRGGDNPSFLSRACCRDEIAQLGSIPQQEAEDLFQTVLTDKNQPKLKLILREQATALASALKRDEYQIAESYWQSLTQLRIICNDEVEQIIKENVELLLENFVLRRYSAYKEAALLRTFDEVEGQLALLRMLFNDFPNEQLKCNIESLEAILRHNKEKKRLEEKSLRNLEAAVQRAAQAEHEAARKAREEADEQSRANG
jgi:hypothetical protein